MRKVTVIIPTVDDSGSVNAPVVITSITTVGAVINAHVTTGMAGPQGPQGDRGPGILSNINHITAGINPPDNPEENDLWIDLT